MSGGRRPSKEDYSTARREWADVGRDYQRASDGWLTPFDGDGIEWHEGLPSPYTYQESDFGKLVSAVHAYESRSLVLRDRLAEERRVRRLLADNVRMQIDLSGAAYATPKLLAALAESGALDQKEAS